MMTIYIAEHSVRYKVNNNTNIGCLKNNTALYLLAQEFIKKDGPVEPSGHS